MRLLVLILTLFFSAMTVSSVSIRAADPETSSVIRFDTPGALNPIIPAYFADPTIKKFGDTYYLYSTTDGNGGGRAPSQVWVSKDFVDWTLVPMNWPLAGEAYWAPEVVKRGEKYCLYFSQPCVIYGAAADSPIGPWTPLNDNRGEVIPNLLVDKVITLDAQAFEDKEGSTFVHWGTWGIYPGHGCGVGKLGSDMKTITDPKIIPNTQIKDFFEAPFMFELNGVYYLTYSSGSCHDSTYRMQYATSDRPDGEFKMGLNNPILSTTADGTVDGPGHHSLLEHDNKYSMVYHRHDIPRTPNGLLRQLCADLMEIDADGNIKKVIPTHGGIGVLATKTETSTNLAFTRTVKADSFYRDTLRNHEYKPEYAVDDNNATLWRPADNKMGHKLSIDLGSVQPVRRIATQFEYATWYYQYLLETSTDGENWVVFVFSLLDSGPSDDPYHRIISPDTEGLVEFQGLEESKHYVVHFHDVENQRGASIVLQASEQVRRIALSRCGQATAILIDSDGNVLHNQRLDPTQIVVIPEVSDVQTEAIEMGQWIAIIVNISMTTHRGNPSWGVSNEQGRIVFPMLIPGATYQVTGRFGDRKVVLKESSVKSGESIFLGQILARQ